MIGLEDSLLGSGAFKGAKLAGESLATGTGGGVLAISESKGAHIEDRIRVGASLDSETSWSSSGIPEVGRRSGMGE